MKTKINNIAGININKTKQDTFVNFE